MENNLSIWFRSYTNGNLIMNINVIESILKIKKINTLDAH